MNLAIEGYTALHWSCSGRVLFVWALNRVFSSTSLAAVSLLNEGTKVSLVGAIGVLIDDFSG